LVATKRFRVWGLVCAVAFLVCELISRPFAELGIADDWSYILTAKRLAETGHIVYNGWATAMIGWQLYVAAGLVKLFGFSFSTVRMTNVLFGVATSFLIERIFVRAGVRERNAVIATLALVLSPVYMLVSTSFMTDTGGMLAIAVCAYCCVRALQAASGGSAIGWLWGAALGNAICGTSRQISWLGVLAMVPSTLWLLRSNRRVLLWGTAAMLSGWGVMAFSLHWFLQQPYSLPEDLVHGIPAPKVMGYMARNMLRAVLEVVLLALPLTLGFVREFRRSGWRVWLTVVVLGIGYTALGIHEAKTHPVGVMLEPTLVDWLGPQGFYAGQLLAGPGPVPLGTGIRIVLTALSLAGLIAVVLFILRLRGLKAPGTPPAAEPGEPRLSWTQLGYLLVPFTLAYFVLLLPRSMSEILDRYMLEIVFVAVLCMVRAYEDFVSPALPALTVALVGLVAVCSIGCTHDMFAFYRARVELAKGLEAAGVPQNTFDGGQEYNGWVELEHFPHINDPRMINPPHQFVKVSPYRAPSCDGSGPTFEGFLHFDPQYGVAFDKNACQGATPFAPARYFRWLGFGWTTIYIVKYGPTTPPADYVPAAGN